MSIDSPAGTDIQVSSQLGEPQATAVLDLARRAAQTDGVGALSEHVILHLRYGGDPQARDVLIWRDGQIAGYAHLDPADQAAGTSGEMIIDPAFRRRGLGRELVRGLIAAAGGHELRLWSHGDLPAATALAASAGFERTRSLWQMRRSLLTQLDEPRLASGITVRAFQAGQDEDAWTELNHTAFARHPEQGSWTRADLELREREPWFDPAGFFLAERDGRLAGFHWTKVHSAPESASTGEHRQDAGGEHGREGDGEHGREGGGEHGREAGGEYGQDAARKQAREAIGEVYVVGIDPGERGSGLGRALTLIGLHHLAARRLAQVMLYVDEDNTPAIRLYESLGFTHWNSDVMFTRAAATTEDASQP